MIITRNISPTVNDKINSDLFLAFFNFKLEIIIVADPLDYGISAIMYIKF